MSSDEVGGFVVPIGPGRYGEFGHIDDLPPVDAESRPYSPWIGRLEMGATAFLGGAYLRGMHEMNDVEDQREAVASAMTDVQAAIDEGNTVVGIPVAGSEFSGDPELVVGALSFQYDKLGSTLETLTSMNTTIAVIAGALTAAFVHGQVRASGGWRALFASVLPANR